MQDAADVLRDNILLPSDICIALTAVFIMCDTCTGSIWPRVFGGGGGGGGSRWNPTHLHPQVAVP